MEGTKWMIGVLDCLGQAIDGAQNILAAILAKARFWMHIQGVSLNERQAFILNRWLEGFEGTRTSSKYAKLDKYSQNTALRDILALVGQGILGPTQK